MTELIPLFDEFTFVLELRMVTGMRNLIHYFAKKSIKLLTAIHEIEFVREVAHQTILLYKGKLVAR